MGGCKKGSIQHSLNEVRLFDNPEKDSHGSQKISSVCEGTCLKMPQKALGAGNSKIIYFFVAGQLE